MIIEAFGPFLEPKFWLLLSFALFAYVFARKGVKPLLGKIDAHITAIKTDLAKAEHLQAEAQSLLAEYTTKHESSMAKADDIVNDARLQAAQLHAAAEKNLADVLKRKEIQLNDRLKQLETVAANDMRALAANLAIDAAKATIAKQSDANLQSQLLAKTVTQLKG